MYPFTHVGTWVPPPAPKEDIWFVISRIFSPSSPSWVTNICSFPFTPAFSASQDLAAGALQSHCQVLDYIQGTEFRQGSVSAILGRNLPTVMYVVCSLPFLIASPSFPSSLDSSLSLLFLLLFLSFLPSLFSRQGLPIYPRVALNPQPSCLSFPSAGITGVCHHAWPHSL